eukprot:3792855-Alexandrium_andersonii.AAC.2
MGRCPASRRCGRATWPRRGLRGQARKRPEGGPHLEGFASAGSSAGNGAADRAPVGAAVGAALPSAAAEGPEEEGRPSHKARGPSAPAAAQGAEHQATRLLFPFVVSPLRGRAARQPATH